VKAAQSEVDEVTGNYNMGLITNNERYNQTIDIWTHTNSKLTFTLMERIKTDNQGFNSIYMMMDSGARGSKEQIRQLSGMRGLMAKPQKSGWWRTGHHREPDPLELQGRTVHPGVLHLHPRCP
jgi:DNA-directed RNA polymerase subunit beta'